MEKKPSLYNAIAEVERMMFAIDNSEEDNIDAQVVEEFKDLRSNVGNAVDRALYRLSALDTLIHVADSDVKRAQARLDGLKRAKESLERYALACVKAATFPLKGESGEFSIKLGTGACEYTVPLIKSKSFTNILGNIPDAEMNIDQRFLEHVSFFRVRGSEVLSALRKGEKLPFAYLYKGEKLEWLKSMKERLP